MGHFLECRLANIGVGDSLISQSWTGVQLWSLVNKLESTHWSMAPLPRKAEKSHLLGSGSVNGSERSCIFFVTPKSINGQMSGIFKTPNSFY